MSNVIAFSQGGKSAIMRKAALAASLPTVEVCLPTELIPIPLPAYMTQRGTPGVAFTDNLTGVSWLYSHTGYYCGSWSFHYPKDEPDAFYGTADAYVPKHVKEAAAPIIATFPPLPKPSYDEDYV